jgi:hypothetical protein
MAAITAAVIGTVGSVAAGAMSSGMIGGGGGGGGGSTGDVKKIPMDPNDKAMRDYFARMTVANANKTYPSFGEFLGSGGDPAKATFDLEMPGMKPSEAAALGFVGGKGEAIPYVPYEDVASGDISSLTNAQRQYLAKERAKAAAAAGQDPGPWAGKMQKLGGKIGRLEHKLETKFAPTPEIEPREQKIQDKLTKLRGKLETATNVGDRPY